jgi:hypothetical protein
MKSVINTIRQKDANAYTPITLPMREDVTEDQDNVAKEFYTAENELNEDDIFIFQFPRLLPMNLEIQEKVKKEEIQYEEPEYDSNKFLIKSEFQNVFKEIPRNTKIGKLRIYKSGKVMIQIGNVNYEVSGGINCKFAQELALLQNEEINEAYLLGKVRDKKLVVTPKLNL